MKMEEVYEKGTKTEALEETKVKLYSRAKKQSPQGERW